MKTEFIAKSDLFRILSLAFSYPDESNLSDLKNLISEFVSCQPKDNPLNPPLLRGNLNEIIRFADSTILKREYSDLFLKGTVSLSESSYNTNLNVIPDVSAFYSAFGMTAKSGDVPDSLPYELQFISLLALKISLARNVDERQIVEDAYKKFLQEHLREFSLQFSNNLKEKTQNNFYLALISLLQNLTSR